VNPRATALFVLVAVAAAVIAWMLASRPEPLPEPPASAAPVWGPKPPLGPNDWPLPRMPPGRMPPSNGLGLPAPAPMPPGSSAAAPPVEAPPAPGTPHFPLDAGVRFGLTGAGIKAAVQDAKADIQHCYEEWSKVSPSLQGRLLVGFRISDGGVVDRVRLVEDAGMGNAAFEGCVLSVMSDMRFDAPEAGGDLEVTYPLVFSNDGGS